MAKNGREQPQDDRQARRLCSQGVTALREERFEDAVRLLKDGGLECDIADVAEGIRGDRPIHSRRARAP
jgi:hypothetical protein